MHIRRQFARLQPRRMELANIPPLKLGNPGNHTLGSYILDPPKSLHLWPSLFQKSVTIYPRSEPDYVVMMLSLYHKCEPGLKGNFYHINFFFLLHITNTKSHLFIRIYITCNGQNLQQINSSNSCKFSTMKYCKQKLPKIS